MFEIRRLILRLSALGKTIFLSSHMLHEVQQVCNRVAILRKGNLVKQGNVSDLLKGSEEIEVRLQSAEETQYALRLLLGARDQGMDWLTDAHITSNKQNQPLLLIDAPSSRSSEINALLAHNRLYAAEIHPHEGSLEELYLEVTSPSAKPAHAGLEALAGSPVQPALQLSSQEERNLHE
jgi:ABC-2 type transport system ATP-binding protein